MRIIILSILLLSNSVLRSQFSQENSVLLPFGNDDKAYGVIPAQEEGVALYREVINYENYNKRKWEVTLFDSDLEFTTGAAFESDYKYYITYGRYSPGFVYLLFQDIELPLKEVFIMRLNLSNGKNHFFQIDEFLPKEIIGFDVLGNSLFITGYDDRKPTLLKYTYGDPRPKVIEGIFEHKNEILRSSVDEKLGYFQVISRIVKKGLGSLILIKQFDEQGNILNDFLLESSKGHRLIDAIAATDSEGNTAIAGMFSYQNAKMSNGVFTAVFKDGQVGPLHYYDYVNLHNSFNYLEAPNKIEKEKNKYRVKKSANSFKINHVPRQISRQNDEWVFLGEVVENSTRFEGPFKVEFTSYTYAITLGIGCNGRIKWDNTFSLNQKTSKNSIQQTFVKPYNKDKIIFYRDGMGVHYKILNDSDDLAPHNLTLLDPFKFDLDQNKMEKLGYEMPKVDLSVNLPGSLMNWYGDVFISYGVVNWSAYDKLNQSFFINKISIQTNAIP